MTRGAVRRFSSLGELPAVRIFVASVALFGCSLEIDVAKAGSQIGWQVATGAGHGAVRSAERKRSSRVIESHHLFPIRDVVAGLAAERRAAGGTASHPLRKLPFVRVRVAPATGAIVEPVFHRAGRKNRQLRLVTLDAGNGCVRTAQGESCFVVGRGREPDGMKRLHRVAVFAAILVRRPGKLAFVNVNVAGGAVRLRDLVDGIRSFRDMALLAGHGGMFAGERIFCVRMHGHGEERRLPPADVVALRALATGSALAELSAMRVGPVAVGAFRKGDGRLEVAPQVALFACDRAVLPQQEKLCFRVIKISFHPHLLPRNRVVARLAGVGKHSLVRIGMAGNAGGEGNPHIFHIRFGPCHLHVAFLAGDALVRTDQRVFRFGMIEFWCPLPIRKRVAGQAILVQLAVVLVDVAAQAIAGEAEKCLVQIFQHDSVPLGRGDVLGRVALLAFEARVAAFERVTGLGVVKILEAGLPVDEIEIDAVVFGMAGDARLARGILHHHARVESMASRNPLANVRMTFQALQLCGPDSDPVALAALRGPAQRGVCLRERAGRDLGVTEGR